MATGIHRLLTVGFCAVLFCSACRTGPPFVANVAYRDAEAAFQRGNLNEALVQIDKSLQELDKGDLDTLWRFRLLKSEVLIWQGRSQDALALLKPGTLLDPTIKSLSARRNTLTGIAESNLQQLDLAVRTFAETERMRGVESPEVMGDLLLGEGKVAAMRHDPQTSELRFRRALQIAKDHDLTFLAGKALGNLGVLHMQQHHYAEAVDHFNASLASAQKLGAQASIVRTTGNLGWAYLQMGDLERASELFEEAQRKSTERGMLADQKTAIMSIAAIAFLRHDYATAEKDYQESLELARRLNDQQETARSLTDLAIIAIKQGDLNTAEKFNSEALEREHAIGDRDTELYTRVNEAEILSGRKDQTTAERLLREVIRDSGTNLTLQSQAFAALAAVDVRHHRLGAAQMDYEAAIAALEKGRTALGREEFELSFPTNGKDIYSDYIGFLMERSKSDEAFRVAELHRARTLTEGLGLQRDLNARIFSVAETRRTAARLGRVILSYWLGPDHSYLWVFRPNASHVFVLPGEGRIRSLVERYRIHLTGVFQSQDVHDADGEELFKILISPVEAWIKPGSEVTIISDGALCGLNFETLPVSSPMPHYWIEDVSITNASSLALISFGKHSGERQSVGSTKTLLLIGDPKSPGNYQPLRHAGDEMGLIQAHFSSEQKTVISGTDATPAAYFKAGPENYSLIHFVAHGTASRVSPLDSAVVLSEDGNSHNLYARDVANFKLHAKLVTISACDSAGSRIYSTEGLVGLSWAFLRAGSQHVIAALWEVNDASTPRLMDRFYAGLAAGEDAAVALRAAKLTLLRSQSIYRRPFYWAPFILYEGRSSVMGPRRPDRK